MSKVRSHLLIKRAAFIAILMAFKSMDAGAIIPICDPFSGLPCPPTLKIFEGEVNQGLRDYQLVAGKDTLVRIFVGVAPDVNVFPLTIDRADLEVINTTTGSVFTVHYPGDFPNAVIHNPISNVTQQFSENSNVNFYLNGSDLLPGDYQFEAHLYSNSTTPVSEFEFGPYSFTAAKKLGLLVAFGYNPNSCPPPPPGDNPPGDTLCIPKDDLGMDPYLSQDPVLWDYIRNYILPTVSRIYPLRSGIGTIDTSVDCTGLDHDKGLRYFVYPDVLDVPDPGLGETQGLNALKRFNQMRERPPPLRPCDQADNITVMLRSRGPCLTPTADGHCPTRNWKGSDYFNGNEGGSGEGSWSVLSLALNATRTGGFGTAGWGLSHELGHDYGLVKGDAPNSDGGGHSKNYCIKDERAFNVVGKKSHSCSDQCDGGPAMSQHQRRTCPLRGG